MYVHIQWGKKVEAHFTLYRHTLTEKQNGENIIHKCVKVNAR